MPENPYAGSIHSREVVRTEDGFPVKLYNFKSALFLSDVWKDLEGIKNSLLQILRKYDEISKSPVKYAIALGWGDYEIFDIHVRAFDICSYKFSRPWNEDNPNIDMRVFKNGKEILTSEKICETGIIILSEEAKLRRRTKSEEEFINSWPYIGDLGPIIEDVQEERR